MHRNFNPLPHTRENQLIRCICYKARHFNPLPHTRENARDFYSRNPDAIFQSTPSYEGELLGKFSFISEIKFQSTPSYEGEPDIYMRCYDKKKISIHSLIRGRTRGGYHGLYIELISIHSLIRGRTKR